MKEDEFIRIKEELKEIKLELLSTKKEIKKLATKDDIKKIERELELLNFKFDILRIATIAEFSKTLSKTHRQVRNVSPRYGPEGGLNNTRVIRYDESLI